MSWGLPGIGRRSSPTICQPRSWCRRRATIRPSRPEMPVMTILRDSPEDMLSPAEPLVEHRLDAVLHLLDLVVEDLVVVIGIAGEMHRLAEVEPVLHGQWQRRDERRIR